MRVRIQRNKCETRLQWSLDNSERSQWNQTFQRVEKENMLLNDYLNELEARFKKIVLFSSTCVTEMTPQELRDKILGIENSSKTPTITQYVDEYYQNTIEQNSKYSEGTKKNYRKAINHLKRFLSDTKRSDTKLNKLDFKLANQFSNYLMSDDSKTGRKGMSEVSANTNIKKFRTIFDQAIDEELMNKNPFKKIKLSNKSPEKKKLSFHQLKQIYQGIELDKEEKIYTRLFVFMSVTGTAYKDCVGLTIKNLEHEDNLTKLTYRRNKTDHTSSQYLTDIGEELIREFNKRPDVSQSEFLTPQVSNQHFNRVLKLIGAKLQIPFRLTSHHGRHTYRMLLDEADIIDPTVINELMGWSNHNSIDAVYRNVTDKRLKKCRAQFNELIKRLKK